MRGKISRIGLLGALTIGIVGCGAPTPTQSLDAQRPNSDAPEALPTIVMPDRVSPSEMVKGDDPEVIETQQRIRRPSIRWRRSYHRGSYYYVPYYYYYWYPRPYYRPYYSGNYWNYYERPGFRYRSHRFRRDYDDRDYGGGGNYGGGGRDYGGGGGGEYGGGYGGD